MAFSFTLYTYRLLAGGGIQPSRILLVHRRRVVGEEEHAASGDGWPAPFAPSTRVGVGPRSSAAGLCLLAAYKPALHIRGLYWAACLTRAACMCRHPSIKTEKRIGSLALKKIQLSLSALFLLNLGPVHFPKYFLCHLSHRIFGRMHGVLNVDKKITNCTVCCKGRDESFEPN
jgi:hypothetical protein